LPSDGGGELVAHDLIRPPALDAIKGKPTVVVKMLERFLVSAVNRIDVDCEKHARHRVTLKLVCDRPQPSRFRSPVEESMSRRVGMRPREEKADLYENSRARRSVQRPKKVFEKPKV
jgi:hypothetical protein